MQKNDYRRAFIMLRSAAPGYGGHARLERRTLTGSLYFIVTAPEGAGPLSAALVGRQGAEYYAAQVGPFTRDRRGQLTLAWPFDPRDIDGRPLEAYAWTAVAEAEGGRCAVVLTGNAHNNPVAALAGRNIVCGSDSYLYFHGVSYFIQERDERLMLEAPGDNLALLDRYGVEYVYVSSLERGDFDVDEAWFADHCDTVFAEGDVYVYRKRGVHWKSTQN